jgi:hypothetical protein
MAMTGNRGSTVTRVTRGSVLIASSVVLVVAAELFMQPCTPRSALSSVVLGCVAGVVLGVLGVRQPDRSSSRQFLVRMGAVPALLVLYVGLVHVARALRSPEAPSGAFPAGGGSWGAAWIAFALVPFVAGVCMVFYSLGSSNARRP